MTNFIHNVTRDETLENYVAEFCSYGNVEPLFVSENGSRAWGYASPTSDHDVKLLFAHNEEAYKQLWEPKDVVVYKPDEMYDFTAWDVRKVLHLLWKGNAQVYELFFSPIVYMTSSKGILFKTFAENVLKESLREVAYHYYGLAYKTYKERVRDVGEPTLKKYFYVVRPLLSLESMVVNGLPTLDFQTLLSDACLYYGLENDVACTLDELLQLKRDGNLTTVEKGRYDHLDKFCEDRLEFWKDNLSKTFTFEPASLVYKTQENFNHMYKMLAFGD